MKALLRTQHTALLALRRNAMRSVLTCLGISIGIAAVIAMMEIGQGSAAAIQGTIAKIGANVVQIDPSDVVSAGVSTGSGGKVTLTPDDCDAIRRECDGVRWAAPSVDCRKQVVYGRRNWSPRNILGTTPDYLLVRDWADLADGATFSDADVRSAACVCLIGQTAAMNLFDGESPVGKIVRINNVAMKVLGVLRPKGANMAGQDQDDFFVAPWTTVMFRLSATRQVAGQTGSSLPQTIGSLSQLYPTQSTQVYVQASALQAVDAPRVTRFEDLDDIWVSATAPEERPLVIARITSLLRQRHHLADYQPDDFRIRDLTEISKNIASTSKLMGNLLLSLALISLVVGGVGIMNIMLVSVTERTREIGLRMAVGARAGDILRQFLAEAVLLCLAGGLLGIALGHGASMAMTTFMQWPTVFSPTTIFAAVGVSATVGLTFGFFPAWKASRLDPIESLRYE